MARKEELQSRVDQVLNYGEHVAGVKISLTNKDIIVINNLLIASMGQLLREGIDVDKESGLGTPIIRLLGVISKMVDPLKDSDLEIWADNLFEETV